MSKTIMSVDFEDKEMITLSIDRKRFEEGVADLESFKGLIKEIEDMIYISLHFNDDVGMKPPMPTFTKGVNI